MKKTATLYSAAVRNITPKNLFLNSPPGCACMAWRVEAIYVGPAIFPEACRALLDTNVGVMLNY